jgi:hypothetical protein
MNQVTRFVKQTTICRILFRIYAQHLVAYCVRKVTRFQRPSKGLVRVVAFTHSSFGATMGHARRPPSENHPRQNARPWRSRAADLLPIVGRHRFSALSTRQTLEHLAQVGTVARREADKLACEAWNQRMLGCPRCRERTSFGWCRAVFDPKS